MTFFHSFQYALVVIAALLFAYSLLALARGWVRPRAGILWAAVWLAAGVAVLWPDVTSRVARTLGIGRGADLVFYCAVIVMLIGFWATYIRLVRIRRDITLLVRHLAIQEAERTGRPDDPDSENASVNAPHRPQ